MNSCGTAQRRLARVRYQQEVRSAYINTWQWYHFRVAPTCPPSTSILIRPGIILPAYRYGLVQDQTYIDTQTCDFTDTTSTGLACSFTAANYHLGIILCYRSAWLFDQTVTQAFTTIGDGVEYASHADAEDSLETYLRGGADWLYELFPLAAMVLRNNGIVGADGAILPIDMVQRGRSYLWRDVRPRVMMSK